MSYGLTAWGGERLTDDELRAGMDSPPFRGRKINKAWTDGKRVSGC